MISKIVENTDLWQRTLAARVGDDHEAERAVLRTAFWSMRDNVIPFVRAIHKDLLGLTVHDDTHLDALWQTADIIAGCNFDLTPIEAFVFGASVLLHDTAMSLAAYPGGLQELRELQIWRDVEAQYGSDDLARVQFIVLRELHAEQAEELANISFRRDGRPENLFLLDDTKLRDALASQIGRIAHSHHWDHRDIVKKLNPSSGGVPGFPSDWTIDEIKVACLLRCADAAHIDSRRAPTFLYAISEISGVSDEHWNFQNRLNQISTHNKKLVFSSGTDFGLQDAPAWWTCYDTLRMIDAEVKGCNAILIDAGNDAFAVDGVMGVESPQLLSKHVRVKGWSPIDAEVRVSDPVRLAKTLGGENLYGRQALPPIRELLQNAADAVRARRTLECRAEDWGTIRITIESDANGQVQLHVDDQGVGMSERVMTGPLIDFGSSFWGSDLARHEFPGLASGKSNTIGKFGIGFFSVFMLGDEVRVASRRYDYGRETEKVLAFEKLSRRPIIRPAVTGEIPQDSSTRVTVLLNDEHRDKFLNSTEIDNQILILVSALDVNIEYRNHLSEKSWSHSANWTESPPEVFLKEMGRSELESDFESMAERTRLIKDSEGRIVGRAAYVFSQSRYGSDRPLISVGGFTNYRPRLSDDHAIRHYIERKTDGPYLPNMAGVILGETSDAIRSYASHSVGEAAISEWATEQAKLIDTERYLDDELVRACLDLMEAGGRVDDLPFAIAGGEFVSWPTVESMVKAGSDILIAIRFRDYSDKFEFRTFESIGSASISKKVKQNLMIIRSGGDLDFLDKDEARGIISLSDPYKLSDHQIDELRDDFQIDRIVSEYETIWGGCCIDICSVDITLDTVKSQSLNNWVLRIGRNRAEVH